MFKKPELEVVKFLAQDVLTTSSNDPSTDIVLPEDPID